METLGKPTLAPVSKGGVGALVAGGIAALLASACCLGPLILLMLGISGAWISNLTALEPYRPAFLVVAFGALFFAHRRIFRAAEACEPGEVCAVPIVSRAYKALFVIVAVLLGIALVYPYVAPLFY